MSATIQAMNEKRNILANQMRSIPSAEGVMTPENHTKFMQLYAETEQLRQSIEAAQLMAKVEAFGEKVEERTQRDEHAGKVTEEGAFLNWMRGSSLGDAELRTLRPAGQQYRGTDTQIKGTAGLGGYLVPQSWAPEIYKIMSDYSGVLKVCKFLDTETADTFNFPVTNDTEVAALITESAGLTVGDSTLTNITLGGYMYSTKIIKASIQLLRDSKYNVAEWIRYTLGERMGKGLNLALTSADGSSKPHGVVSASTQGATHSAITRAKLVELKFSVPSPYRQSGVWMMNSTSLGQICALAFGSGDDRPLYQTGDASKGEPDRIEGHAVVINENMDSVDGGGADKYPVVFGDFKQYIVRRVGDMEIFPFNELYMANLHKAWTGYQAFDAKLFYTSAVKHLLTT